MKIKEFLLQKVNKDTLKNESVKRSIKLTVCVAFIVALIFQFVGCLFVPMSAYAAVPGDTVVINDIPELPVVTLTDMDAVFESNGTIYYGISIGSSGISYYTATDLAIDVYSNLSWTNQAFRTISITNMAVAPLSWVSDNSVVQQSTVILKAGTYRFNDVINIDVESITSDIEFNINGEAEIEGQLVPFYLHCNYIYIVKYPDDTIRMIYHIDYTNAGGEVTDSEESVDVYLTGDGWTKEFYTIPVDFQNVTFIEDVSTNDDFGNIFISNTNYNEVNAPSCPTLAELLREYTGSFDSIVDMLNSTNYQEYEDFVHGLEQDAFDRGVSTGFGENVLGSAFNAPLTALNQWVLFETSSGLDVTMGGVFTGLIALSVLIILLKMFSGG